MRLVGKVATVDSVHNAVQQCCLASASSSDHTTRRLDAEQQLQAAMARFQQAQVVISIPGLVPPCMATPLQPSSQQPQQPQLPSLYYRVPQHQAAADASGELWVLWHALMPAEPRRPPPPRALVAAYHRLVGAHMQQPVAAHTAPSSKDGDVEEEDIQLADDTQLY